MCGVKNFKALYLLLVCICYLVGQFLGRAFPECLFDVLISIILGQNGVRLFVAPNALDKKVWIQFLAARLLLGAIQKVAPNSTAGSILQKDYDLLNYTSFALYHIILSPLF